MGLVLDTHYAYALAGAPGRLSAREVAFLAAPPAEMLVSAVSIWEMRLKWQTLHASGGPKDPISPSQALQILASQPIEFLPLMPAHAAARLAEPLSHTDPFDELLLVQAQFGGHKLLTRDAKLAGHPYAISV